MSIAKEGRMVPVASSVDAELTFFVRLILSRDSVFLIKWLLKSPSCHFSGLIARGPAKKAKTRQKCVRIMVHTMLNFCYIYNIRIKGLEILVYCTLELYFMYRTVHFQRITQIPKITSRY